MGGIFFPKADQAEAKTIEVYVEIALESESGPEARARAREHYQRFIPKLIKIAAKRYADEPVFPANFGRVLIGQESLDPKAQSLKGFVERYRSEYLPNAISDGVRESDVVEWWALPRPERWLLEELMRYQGHLIEQEAEQRYQSETVILSALKQWVPGFGIPQPFQSGPSRPLPDELRPRLAAYIMKTLGLPKWKALTDPNAYRDVLSRLPQDYPLDSFNAIVRKLIIDGFL